MRQGSFDSCPLMVCECMPVDSLERGVSAMAQALDDVLVRHACSMEGGGHMVAVVVEAAVREAVPL